VTPQNLCLQGKLMPLTLRLATNKNQSRFDDHRRNLYCGNNASLLHAREQGFLITSCLIIAQYQ